MKTIGTRLFIRISSDLQASEPMKSLAFFALAALAEISGCYCFWVVQKNQKNVWLLAVGCISLICFASILARVDSPFAGRAYAAYGGIYIAMSIIWAMTVEKSWPDRWDLIGMILAISGTLMILFGPRRG